MSMKMKNDYAHLRDLRIDIQTDNDIYYQEFALLLDKPEFLNLLPILRQTYFVTNLFPLKDFDDELDYYERNHFFKNTKVKIDLSKYKKVAEIKDSFPDLEDFIQSANVLPEVLDAECDLICYEFNRPPYFLDPIKQALFCGAVNDKYFKPTQARTVDFSVMGAWPTLERIAIFVSPTSTYEDVKEEFRKARKLMKTDKRLSYYKPRTDTAPNIRKYRHWYWQHLSGKRYKTISDEWMDNPKAKQNDPGADENFVLKGINTYKRLLET